MHPLIHRVYEMMPHRIRQLAAELHAGNLQRFRYNSTTPLRIKHAIEREKMSFNEWKSWQEEKLEIILSRAVKHVPYYREYWNEHGLNDNAWKKLNNWPILTKDEVRANNLKFLADDCNPKAMYTEYTSGTTGTPLKVWWSKETTLEYYALFERRIKNWHQVNLHQPYLMIGGRLIVPIKRTEPPFWIHNRKMNQLYLSSYHLSERNVLAYIDAINKFKPEYAYGYASSMYTLASFIKEAGLKVHPMKCAISNAEHLFTYQKQCIEEVFKCQMVNTYGMSELAVAACSNQNSEEINIWPEVGMMQVYHYANNEQVPLGTEGRFIATSLLNVDMPFIQYDTGDAGSIQMSSGGINYYSIASIGGRMDDMIRLRDGRLVGRLDPVFKENYHIKEAQIIQQDYESFEIKIVPTNEYQSSDGEHMASSLKERVGEVNVSIQIVDSIARSNTGKFKAVICRIQNT